jgi:hypothetical protein
MKTDMLKLALQYAKKIGNDAVREAGVKDGWHYYHVYRSSEQGHKKGLSHIVKISEMGQCVSVENLTERMWAVKQEVLINNL